MTAHHESQEQPPQVVSRLGLYLPTALLLTGALAWCGFWFYSAHAAEETLAALKSEEAAKGRAWTCADQKIGGFPFRLELTCASVTLSATPDDRPTRIRTGALHAATQIYAPSLVLADVDGPMVVESEGSTTTTSWNNLRVSVRFSNQLERLSLVMADAQIDYQPAGGDKLTSAAKSAEAHVRYDSARPAADRALDVALQLNDVSSPIMNDLLGSPDRMDFSLAGVATKLAGLPAQGWRNLLETWRTSGGDLTVDSGKLAKGSLQIETKGVLALDPARRLQGKLDISATGLGPLIARLGGGGASQLIGPLFTRKDGSPVQWPVQLKDGRIQMGPLRTGPVLGALY